MASLSYADLANVDTFHYKNKKWHLLKSSPISSEKSREAINLLGADKNSKFIIDHQYCQCVLRNSSFFEKIFFRNLMMSNRSFFSNSFMENGVAWKKHLVLPTAQSHKCSSLGQVA